MRQSALRARRFACVLEFSNPHENERDDLDGIPSIGVSAGAGMTEESEGRIKARISTSLFGFVEGRERTGRRKAGQLGWPLPPRECLDPEPSAAESHRDEEEKKSAKEPMPRSVIRVALSCPLTFRGAEVERGSPSPPEESKGRFGDVIPWPWTKTNEDGVNQKSITIQGHCVKNIPGRPEATQSLASMLCLYFFMQ